MNKAIIILVILALLALIFFRMRSCVVKDYQEYQVERKLDSDTISKHLPVNYKEILNNKRIVFDRTDLGKRRNPISEFYVDNEYYVRIYKIDTIANQSLKSLMNENFTSTELSFTTTYTEFDNSIPYSIYYKVGAKQENTSTIYFTLYGTNTHAILKNDTMAYYSSDFKNWSVSYKKDGPYDIYSKIKDKFDGVKVPIEIMFLKHNHNLYFILLSGKSAITKLKSQMLYNLIVRK